MNLRVVAWAVLPLGMAAWGDDAAQRVKLSGSWTLEGGAKDTWSFENKGNAMRVTHSEGEHKVAEFECSTAGKECDVKDFGKDGKVSMWFNGPKLVEVETKGSELVQHRFQVVADSDAMELEIVPLVPGGKTETLRFKRISLSSKPR
jgi:hypothetical protein